MAHHLIQLVEVLRGQLPVGGGLGLVDATCHLLQWRLVRLVNKHCVVESVKRVIATLYRSLIGHQISN